MQRRPSLQNYTGGQTKDHLDQQLGYVLLRKFKPRSHCQVHGPLFATSCFLCGLFSVLENPHNVQGLIQEYPWLAKPRAKG
ncbi:hypothetical protein K474DRAFT_1666257 [Panus rudis PR-1116 ss-1]|nr:hypothetical protein K474DRAFT_1666257 [Panus rudis PR-1116 ss-1]